MTYSGEGSTLQAAAASGWLAVALHVCAAVRQPAGLWLAWPVNWLFSPLPASWPAPFSGCVAWWPAFLCLNNFTRKGYRPFQALNIILFSKHGSPLRAALLSMLCADRTDKLPRTSVLACSSLPLPGSLLTPFFILFGLVNKFHFGGVSDQGQGLPSLPRLVWSAEAVAGRDGVTWRGHFPSILLSPTT